MTTYFNTDATRDRLRWDLFPDHCVGDYPNGKFIDHDEHLGKYRFHNDESVMQAQMDDLGDDPLGDFHGRNE